MSPLAASLAQLGAAAFIVGGLWLSWVAVCNARYVLRLERRRP